ncbi:MAG: hypothetical protein V3V55_01545 [Rhodospirillales bacterium]
MPKIAKTIPWSRNQAAESWKYTEPTPIQDARAKTVFVQEEFCKRLSLNAFFECPFKMAFIL